MRFSFAALVALVACCGSFASAQWMVDDRCLRRHDRELKGRGIRGRVVTDVEETNSSPPDPEIEDSKMSTLVSTSSNLRGTEEDVHRELDYNYDFQLRMHWKEGYCWQEEWIQRKWCIACGSGDRLNDNGRCDEDDVLWLRLCTEAETQRFVWQPVSGTGGAGKLKPLTREDLCFEEISSSRGKWRLKKCKQDKKDQLIIGFEKDGPFELRPYGQSERIFSQEHDPKSFEEVYAEVTRKARGDHTNLWEVYKPSRNNNVSPEPPSTPKPPSSKPPSPSSGSSSCNDPYDLNLMSKEEIRDGDYFLNARRGLYLEQKNNGNLVVRKENTVLWESGVRRSSGDYFTRLQGDGNLLTYKGKPDDQGERVWKSGPSGSVGAYFLGLDCDGDKVAIYKGTPNDPGIVLWSSKARPSPSPPSPSPKPPSPPKASGSSSGPEVPFHLGATEFSDYVEKSSERYGDRECGPGPVDAKKIDDSKCRDRGGRCAVGWTEGGEALIYDFESGSRQDVNIIVRASSSSTSKKFRLKVDGKSGPTWNAPGKGYDDYDDYVWKDLSLSEGSHRVEIRFMNAGINVCSISVKNA